MALRNVAKFVFGINKEWMRAKNADLTTPTPARTIGGTGPFDFSGAAVPASVPLTIKFDNLSEVTVNVDMSAGVSDLSAVTVAEAVTRCNLAAPADMLASSEVGTARFKLAYNGTDDPAIIQVYGEFAKLVEIGQGLGTKYLKSNTLISFQETPTMKEDEVIEIAPASGASIEITIEGYKKGFAGQLIDAAEDFQMMQLVESGVIDTDGEYHDPNEDTVKKVFEMEIFSPVYKDGSNKEADIVNWQRVSYLKCTGSVGERTKEKGWMRINYAIKGVNYVNELGVRDGAIIRKHMTVAQWNALDFNNV